MAAPTTILREHAAATDAPVLMQVAGLAKRYGEQQALADISFSARAGEVLGLIGPNGAGKTTLLEAIAGVLPTDGGEVLWREKPLPWSRRRDCIFYLPDGMRPWEEQYAIRVIQFIAEVYGRSDSDVAEMIALLGLAPVLRKRVLALSKGYSRRLMLALAFMTPQPVLLMDEPFDGFDLRQTREIMGVLRDVAGRGRTFVLAIHQLPDAERVCDRFVLLTDGRVRGLGTLDELRQRTGQGSLEEAFLALT
jgi:ABC-type multidrug transport system ATPase subunit